MSLSPNSTAAALLHVEYAAPHIRRIVPESDANLVTAVLLLTPLPPSAHTFCKIHV